MESLAQKKKQKKRKEIRMIDGNQPKKHQKIPSGQICPGGVVHVKGQKYGLLEDGAGYGAIMSHQHIKPPKTAR